MQLTVAARGIHSYMIPCDLTSFVHLYTEHRLSPFDVIMLALMKEPTPCARFSAGRKKLLAEGGVEAGMQRPFM